MKEYCLLLFRDVPLNVYIISLVVFCVGIVAFFIFFERAKLFRYSMILFLSEYVVLLYGATILFRESMTESTCKFLPFWSYFEIYRGDETDLLPENIMNIVVFIPIGFILGGVSKKNTLKRTFIYGLCLSLGIEFFQYLFKKGLAEFDDVFHNTIGCLLGYGLYIGLLLLIRKTSFERNV